MKLLAIRKENVEPLKLLLKKETAWIGTIDQQEAFSNIKELLITPPVVKYYKVNEDITISVDASSTAEGKRLVIETDHKLLESIFKKPGATTTKKNYVGCPTIRLQCYLQKGCDIPISDILSRDCDHRDEEIEMEEELEVPLVLSMSARAKERYRETTGRNIELQKLISIIDVGWPENVSDVDHEVSFCKLNNSCASGPSSTTEILDVNTDKPRSYIVKTDIGTYRRNTAHLKRLKAEIHPRCIVIPTANKDDLTTVLAPAVQEVPAANLPIVTGLRRIVKPVVKLNLYIKKGAPESSNQCKTSNRRQCFMLQ
ncbi:RNase H-like domain found in reverse transcriptase [Popillia japonica]|uniref:RNase H-like domain found in reverse transcriptase n=1 Tax=Popillia japonica TaxID=7064 RepID=A0AAW1IEQ8_POPJA